MPDRYRQALEGLRERCAQEAERITARRRAVAAMSNNEAVKPCEAATAIRKIDVQQYCECAAREIEMLHEQLRLATVDQAAAEAEANDAHAENKRLAEALEELITWIPSADTYRRLGFDPEAPMRVLRKARATLAKLNGDDHD